MKHAVNEQGNAVLDVILVAVAIIALTGASLVINLVPSIYHSVTDHCGPQTAELLVNLTFLLLTGLLWLTYRRWKAASARARELTIVLSSISPDVLLVVNTDRVIQNCNEAVAAMFGYEVDDVIGQKTDFLYDDRRQNSREDPQEIYQALERTGFHIGTAVGRKKAGEKIHVEIITARLLKSSGAVLLLRDITERKLLEEEFRQAQKMEAIGRLAGGIAHDFNNILTTLIGNAEMLARKFPKEDPARLEVEEMLKASERAAKLTQQLLALARRQVIQPAIINMNDVIGNVVSMIRRLINENIELVTHLDGQLGMVEADPVQMEQVLINLVVNARDAMPGGGRIVLTTERITLDKSGLSGYEKVLPGEYVVMSVSDTGVGMDEEIKKKLFEPFFTTKEKGKGTGLGLSTSYGIIRQCGGHMTVFSEKGQGTTFKVYLPRTQGAKSSDACPDRDSSQAIPRGNETVLVAEDDPSIRNFASRTLREQGYTVLEAANGKEAFKIYEEANGSREKIKLLFSDVVMPEMGGRELTEKIRMSNPELKVLLTSGYSDDTSLGGRTVNARIDYLQKPYSRVSLTSKVRQVLDGGRKEAIN